jgi:glycosyltransferase involved in cell wall biosynthesis
MGMKEFGESYGVMDKTDVTIIIPAYNEEEGIADVITQLKEFPENNGIIVVDDSSTDNTYKLVSDKVIRHPYNKGYGAALKTGIKKCRG